MVEWQSFSSSGERAGLALIATAGLASAVATFSLLAYIVWYSFISVETSTPLPRGVRAFTRSSLGSYLISLLVCDFLQGAAFTMNYRWAHVGYMKESTICTIQGAVSEVGDLGAALWSIAISYHTFSLLFLVQKPHRLVAPIALTLGWIVLIVLPIIGPTLIQKSHRGKFYGLSGAWCWVGISYDKERLIYLYIWIFIALGSSFVIYTLIYLRFSNYITYGEDGKLAFSFRRRQITIPVSPTVTQAGGSQNQQGMLRSSRRVSKSLPGCFDWMKDTRDGINSTTGSSTDPTHSVQQPPVGKHLKQVARRLMWYPFMYTIVVLPVSVCRMGVLAGWTPPFGLFVFAGICFSGSGVSNVLLFIFTRHSFIKQVANNRGTRVVITTQRITVREDACDGVEMRDFNTSDNGVSPKSPFYIRSESEAESSATKEKVAFEEDSIDEPYEPKGGIHISVFGK